MVFSVFGAPNPSIEVFAEIHPMRLSPTASRRSSDGGRGHCLSIEPTSLKLIPCMFLLQMMTETTPLVYMIHISDIHITYIHAHDSSQNNRYTRWFVCVIVSSQRIDVVFSCWTTHVSLPMQLHIGQLLLLVFTSAHWVTFGQQTGLQHKMMINEEHDQSQFTHQSRSHHEVGWLRLLF